MIAWFALIGLIYMLPSATRPDFEERRLQREIAALEKEVAELAEDLHAINPEIRDRKSESKKSK